MKEFLTMEDIVLIDEPKAKRKATDSVSKRKVKKIETSGLPEQTKRADKKSKKIKMSTLPDLAKAIKGQANLDWVKHLKEKGWCVVKGVITQDEAVEKFKEIVTLLYSIYPENKGDDPNLDDFSTLDQKRMPPNMHGGLMQQCGISQLTLIEVNAIGVGHLQPVWDLRQDERVVNVFAKIFGTKKLFTSIDAINVTLHNPRSRDVGWEHIDQGSSKIGFCCAQGLVNLLPNGPEDGGLEVLEGSHLLHESFWKKFGIEVAEDW